MIAILAHIRPLDRATNTRVDVYVASTPGPAYQGLGGFVWESAITRRPRASIELFAIDLAPGTRVAQADFEIDLGQIQEVNTFDLHWKGAPVTIYRADDQTWPAPIEFDGIVTDPRRNLDTNVMTLVCAVKLKYDKPLLTKGFDETDLEFDADKRTNLLPAGFGICLNIQPVLFDSIRNFYMIDGYGNLTSVDWLGEGLSTLGPPQANYADYTTLKAAYDAGDVTPGRWVTCLSEGIIALGAPPVGIITCHATLGYGMTGALIRRAVVDHAEVDLAMVETASLDALDVAVPYPIHYWTADQVQVNDLVEALAAACNASPIITMQGKLAVLRPFGGTLIGEFVRKGFSEPAVTNWKTQDTVTPYWRLTARAGRPVRVMALDEINYEDALIDRGLYKNDETYRIGHVVWLRNKSQWLYINATPGAGHAPPDGTLGDEYWQRMAPAPDANDLQYTAAQTIGGAIAQVEARTKAFWQIELDVGESGADAFVTVRAEQEDGEGGTVVTSSVSIGAREFLIFNPVDGEFKKAFEVSGGNVRIYGNLQLDGSVTTNNLVANAVSLGDTVTLSSPLYGSGTSTWNTAVTYNFTVPATGGIDWGFLALVTASQGFPSGDKTWNMRILSDGVQLVSSGGEKTSDTVAMSARVIWGPGAHSIVVEHKADSSVRLDQLTLSIIGLKR